MERFMMFDEYEDDIVDDFEIKTMVNQIVKPLIDGQFKYYHSKVRPSQRITVQLTWTTGPSPVLLHLMVLGQVEG
jgi:hypothetical protein